MHTSNCDLRLRTSFEIFSFSWIFLFVLVCTSASAGFSLSDIWASTYSTLATFFAWRMLARHWGSENLKLLCFVATSTLSLTVTHYSYHQIPLDPEARQLLSALELIQSIEAENDLSLPILNRAELSNTPAPANIAFFADGAVDVWAYILYISDLGVPYFSQIAIQEKGLLWTYVTLSYLVSDFNHFFFALAGWIAIIFSSVTSVAIYSGHFSQKGRGVVFSLMALLPEFGYWAGLLHKDAFVSACLLGMLYCTHRFFTIGSPKWAPILGIGLAYMATLRSGLFIPSLMLTACIVLCSRKSAIKIGAFAFSLLITTMFLIAIAPEALTREIFNNAIIRPTAKIFGGNHLELDYQNLIYRGNILENTSITRDYFNHDFSIRTIFLAPIHIIAYFLYPLYALPPQNISSNFTLVGAIFFALLSPFALASLPRNISNRGFILFVLLPIFVIGAAIIFAGPFVLERYRVVLFPFLIISIWSGISESRKILFPLLIGVGIFFLTALTPIIAF